MHVSFLGLKGQEKKLSGVVALSGNDDYLRERAAEQIKASLNLSYPEFNCQTFDEPSSIEEIVNACIVMPFMSEARFVVVKDYASPNGKEKRERELLKKYLQDPVRSTTLVFSSEKLSGVTENIDEMDYVDCNRLDPASLERWICLFCKKEGKVISPQNARLIADYCLNDMTRISTEVKKICIYSQSEVTKADIDLMIEKDSEIKMYELANEIAEKNGDKAFAIARSLLIKGVTASSLVTSVYKTFRRMFFSLVADMSLKEMSSYLGVQPFAVAKAREAAQRFSQKKLKTAVDICARADEDIRKNINTNAVVNFMILSLLCL